MPNSAARARLLAEVDDVLKDTPVDVVLEAVRRAAKPDGEAAHVEHAGARPPPSDTTDAFRRIFDGSGMGIALVDPGGRPLRCNSALARMLGYDVDELGRMAFPQFTHPDDIALDGALFQELVAGKRSQYQIERRYVRKNGSTVYARLTVSLAPGDAKHAIAIVEDIGVEREERARHAATRRTLEARVAELSAMHDLAAALRDSSRPIAEVLADVARTLHAATGASDTSGVRITLGEVAVGAGAFDDAACTTSATFGPPAGRQGRVEVSHAEPRSRPASPDGVVDERRIVQTVADYIGAALDRRRTEERLALAVTAGKVAVWDLDFRAGTIAWPGQAPTALRAWPWGSAGTVAGFMEIVHPDDRALVERELRAATDDPSRQGRYQAEYRIVSPEGGVQVILASGQAIYDDASRPERMFGVAVDVTERRKLERSLLQAQKMEAIGQLAGGIAHDFNNLLCVILGYGELVAEALGPAHPETSRIAQIVKAGRAAEALTRQLLAFSRRQVLQPRVLDLNHVVQGVERMLRRLIGEDVALVIDLAPEPAVVRADPGQIEQVLVNLAANARDAMPKGGRLTIRTTFDAGGARDDAPGTGTATDTPVGPWVVLSVTDTGTGMNADAQAHAFEPFFTTKPPGSGTGLGLASVHGIVHQSGGRIGFSSKLGEGTEFRIHLPRLALAAEEGDRAPIALGSFDGRETVLVVEDQEPVRQILRIWLERRGYRVLDAADGRAGMEVAATRDGALDLLVTDVVMPRASGRELANTLRVRDPELPVIYVSGYTSDVIAQRGVIDPGDRLLEKPLSEASFLRAVRESLDAAPRARTRRESPRA